ncbi:MAG: hypothetical protein WBN09_03785 [Woeseiaceae bacterium]
MTNKAILIVTAALLLPLGAFAQTLTDIDALSPEDRRAYFQAMSDEERAAKREQLHKEWEALPDEQKQAMREKRNAARDERRAAQREKWQSMSDEERQAAREKSRARHAEREAIREAHGGKPRGDKSQKGPATD